MHAEELPNEDDNVEHDEHQQGSHKDDLAPHVLCCRRGRRRRRRLTLARRGRGGAAAAAGQEPAERREVVVDLPSDRPEVSAEDHLRAHHAVVDVGERDHMQRPLQQRGGAAALRGGNLRGAHGGGEEVRAEGREEGDEEDPEKPQRLHEEIERGQGQRLRGERDPPADEAWHGVAGGSEAMPGEAHERALHGAPEGGGAEGAVARG
mmetsp:Transcript_6574/g.16333  ORF Transcript_6574/g.16333 Transcript_6574/m.16333 type:complete len:207 (+) Transcript_6574:1698-2318(+)